MTEIIQEALNIKLLEYISQENLEKVKEAIEQGAQIEYKYGIALDMAIHMGNIMLLDYLLKLNSDLNFDIRLAFKKTIEKNNYDMYRYLKTKFQDNIHYSIRLAAKLGCLEITQYIINSGYICLDEQEPLAIAIRNDHTQLVNLFLENGMKLGKQKDDLITFCLHRDKLTSLKLIIQYNGLDFNEIKQLEQKTRNNIKVWLNEYIIAKKNNIDKDNNWIFKYMQRENFSNKLDEKLTRQQNNSKKVKL